MTKSIVGIFQQSKQRFDERQFLDAYVPLREYVSKFRDLAPVFCLMGSISLEAGKLTQASWDFQAALGFEPDCELASAGLFHSLWESGNYDAAIDEIDRFVHESTSDRYEDFAETLTEFLREYCELSSDEVSPNVSGTSADSRESKGLKKRWTSSRNPIDQLKGIEKGQQRARKDKKEGRKEESKLIESLGKSNQRLKHDLDRIDSPEDIDLAGVSQSKRPPAHEMKD